MGGHRCDKPGATSVSPSLQRKAGELMKGAAAVRGTEGSAGLGWTPRTMLLPGGAVCLGGQVLVQRGLSLRCHVPGCPSWWALRKCYESTY